MNKIKKDNFRPADDALWFVPLGGSGEIGMNVNLYGTMGKWLMVDCGISFPDETMPGIEIIMPDVSFIAERRADLVGLVITHGHEDHIGAIEHLWDELQCPIYATPFTAMMIRGKLGRSNKKARIVELPVRGSFELGPFKGELIHVTHSIPEAHMLLLTTPNGTVLHTGDWKLDPDPVVGQLSDEARLQELGREDVMAMICDSTNAMVPGHSGSEIEAQRGLTEQFGLYRNRIAVTCFASNIARLKSIALAARAQGRYVALCGRSLWRNAEIAAELGYLPEFGEFLSEHEAMQSPRDKIVIVCTGCQGEPRSALARIAVNDHPMAELEAGDVVIYSSRDIPGNEKAIGRVQNLLVAAGIKVVTSDLAKVHVSGHPAQEELTKLYHWVRPKLSVPVHGEIRHQMAHADLAAQCNVPAAIIPANGQIIRLGPGLHEVVGEVPVGIMGLDGKVLRRIDRQALKHRRKLGFAGVVVVSMALDRQGQPAHAPQVTMVGLEDEEQMADLQADLADIALEAYEGLSRGARQDDQAVKNTVMQGLRRFLNDMQGKKPIVDVHVMRV
jgi:ribonuclease J